MTFRWQLKILRNLLLYCEHCTYELCGNTQNLFQISYLQWNYMFSSRHSTIHYISTVMSHRKTLPRKCVCFKHYIAACTSYHVSVVQWVPRLQLLWKYLSFANWLYICRLNLCLRTTYQNKQELAELNLVLFPLWSLFQKCL